MDRPNPWLTLSKLLGALVAAGMLAAGFFLPYLGGIGLAAKSEAQKFLDTSCDLKETTPPQKTQLFASDGKTLLATIFTQDRQPIPLTQVPTFLQKALVATEDRRFYSHHGVDMRGLVRSAVSTSSGDTQGGSTLTMQYVKQIRYYQAGTNVKQQQAAISQNINRKIEDAKCAISIEKRESKATILDNYLNIAFFGENSYGLETASETYFDKPARELSPPQSALLVGLLRAPSQFDPFVAPTAARERRNQVLQNMVDDNQLTQRQANVYARQPISLATSSPPKLREGCANAPKTVRNAAFFCDYAVNWLQRVQGISLPDLQTGGYKIITTLNPRLQNSMERGIARRLPATSPMTAIMPAVDPRSGDVLAMATSKLYGNTTSIKDHAHTSYPVFTSYVAQGASTYKLFPLLAALFTGVPSDWQLETPTGPYKPYNCSSASKTTNGDAQEYYDRNETLRSATAKSSNTFFVGLADQLFGCDLKPIVQMAQQLGVSSLAQPSDVAHQTIAQTVMNLQRAQQLVLGDLATSPLELASAYAAVANGGVYHPPAPIRRITDVTGHNVAVKRSPAVRVLPAQVAAQAVDILTGDTRYPGTSTAPFENWYATNSSLVAGKTGTSVAVVHGRETDRNAALWFVGMTPQLVASSAVVNLNSPSAPASGLPGVSDPSHDAYGEYAAGVWLSALQPSLHTQHWTWPNPDTVAGVTVPDVRGLSLPAASNRLASAGFRMDQLDAANGLACASTVTTGNVAFYGPHRAPKGTTVTVCPSSGAPQDVYVPPPPPPPPTYIPPPTTVAPAPQPNPATSSSSSAPQPTHTRSPVVKPKPSPTEVKPSKPKPTKTKGPGH